MNMTLSDMETAILFVVIAAAWIVWFRAKLVSGSLSRMRRMMTSVGLDPDNLASSYAGAGLDMQAVRTRCRMCPAEVPERSRRCCGRCVGDCQRRRILETRL